jgi:Uma2 family endonuclease
MFTIYNEKEHKFQLVEEPDPSLSYTYADYLQWKFEEQVELIRGKIFKMSPAPAPRHQQISVALSSEIYNFLKQRPCKVFTAPFDVRLPEKDQTRDHEITTVVQPDICVICNEAKIDARGCLGAPDLIIEILSPGNTEKEVKLKYSLYERSGVKEYWVVYPTEQNIAVFALNENGKYDGAKIYAGNDTISSCAITGLIIKLNDVFSK